MWNHFKAIYRKDLMLKKIMIFWPCSHMWYILLTKKFKCERKDSVLSFLSNYFKINFRICNADVLFSQSVKYISLSPFRKILKQQMFWKIEWFFINLRANSRNGQFSHLAWVVGQPSWSFLLRLHRPCHWVRLIRSDQHLIKSDQAPESRPK